MQPISDDTLTTSKICVAVAKCERALRDRKHNFRSISVSKISVVFTKNNILSFDFETETEQNGALNSKVIVHYILVNLTLFALSLNLPGKQHSV